MAASRFQNGKAPLQVQVLASCPSSREAWYSTARLCHSHTCMILDRYPIVLFPGTFKHPIDFCIRLIITSLEYHLWNLRTRAKKAPAIKAYERSGTRPVGDLEGAIHLPVSSANTTCWTCRLLKHLYFNHLFDRALHSPRLVSCNISWSTSNLPLGPASPKCRI